MTLPGLAVAILFSLFSLVPGPAYRLFPPHFHGALTVLQVNLQLGWRSLVNSLLGAAIGSGVLYGIAWVYLKLRKIEGMGLGDVKLMAMAGAFLGPMLTLFVLCTASLLGGAYGVFILLAVFRKRVARYRARFGPQASIPRMAGGANRHAVTWKFPLASFSRSCRSWPGSMACADDPRLPGPVPDSRLRGCTQPHTAAKVCVCRSHRAGATIRNKLHEESFA